MELKSRSFTSKESHVAREPCVIPFSTLAIQVDKCSLVPVLSDSLYPSECPQTRFVRQYCINTFNIMFLSCRPFVVITLSTGLGGVEVTSVSWLGQLTVSTGQKHTYIRWDDG